MAELSIIELIVYAIIGYSGVLALIVSAFREVPGGRSQSGIRVIWLIPSMLTLFMLASAGEQINFTTDTTTEIGYNVTDSSVISNSTVTSTETVTFVQPVWITLHMLLFIVVLIYIIWNILNLLIKH